MFRPLPVVLTLALATFTVACATGGARHTSLPKVEASPESVGAEAGQDLAEAETETSSAGEPHDPNGKSPASSMVANFGVIGPSKTAGVLGSLRGASPFVVGGMGMKVAVARRGKITVTARSSGIDQRVAESILRGLTTKIGVCYQAALSAAPKLAGTLIYRLDVDAVGYVTNVILMDSRLPQPNVVGCTTRLIERARFPRSPGGEIEAELEFTP